MKKVTPRKLLNYIALLSIVYISYRLYTYVIIKNGEGREEKLHKSGGQDRGPADLDHVLKVLEKNKTRHPGDSRLANTLHERNNEDLFEDIVEKILEKPMQNEEEIQSELDKNAEDVIKVDKAEKISKLTFDDLFEVPDQSEFENKRPEGKKRAEFQVEEPVNWELEEELKERRKKFLAEVEKRAEQYDPAMYQDFQEKDDHLAFVTAGSDRSWAGVLQFVHSVQYHYPHSDIGIFDLGFSKERRLQLETFCKVTVMATYMKFWPKHMVNLKLNLWRPMILQMGLAHFGHIVYVEPDRFLMTKKMKDYIEHSRRYGVTIVGRKLQYSPYVVTHPEMYYFFPVDTRKLQRINMFEVNMMIMHNSQPVRHNLMRHLVACTLEEYCISPPGSQMVCNQQMYPGSKKYANCHRYDLSAMNILLDKWFEYNPDLFLVRDIVTAHYDGKDVSKKVKVCSQQKREEI